MRSSFRDSSPVARAAQGCKRDLRPGRADWRGLTSGLDEGAGDAPFRPAPVFPARHVSAADGVRAVARFGSVTRAAEALHLAQPPSHASQELAHLSTLHCRASPRPVLTTRPRRTRCIELVGFRAPIHTYRSAHPCGGLLIVAGPSTHMLRGCCGFLYALRVQAVARPGTAHWSSEWRGSRTTSSFCSCWHAPAFALSK